MNNNRFFSVKHLLGSFFVLCLFLMPSCGQPKNGLKVAATPVPHAQMLEFIKPDLKAQGIDLIIIVTDDYNVPNRSLANHEVDANFFQHVPFMNEQIQEFHYPIESIAKVEVEPMGIYSKKIKSLDDLRDHAVIAIPNDPTNEARALLLLQNQGVIQLNSANSLNATVLDIFSNPKNIKFIEMDAAMIPRTLTDVDAAAINTNYALEAKLSPMDDAIAIEDKNSPYANVLVIRTADEKRNDLQTLKTAMTSDKMRDFILKKYKGAVLPAF